jgi:hypothetical protein
MRLSRDREAKFVANSDIDLIRSICMIAHYRVESKYFTACDAFYHSRVFTHIDLIAESYGLMFNEIGS